jgi:hypothetical protein
MRCEVVLEFVVQLAKCSNILFGTGVRPAEFAKS